LRLAVPAYKLWEFKKLKTAANLGLALDPSDSEKELLKEYVEKSKDQREIILDRNSLEQQIRQPSAELDTLIFSSNTSPFSNLNILHYTVVTGDITLMEEVVALGAALDFPVWDRNAPGVPPSPAPPGSTALLLACAFLAMYGDKMHRDPNFRSTVPAEFLDSIDRKCECAIRLVHLGANCEAKLQIPTQRPNAPFNQHDPVTIFRALDLGGKTAQEMAIMSHQRELIRAIKVMTKTENVHLTQCRCGSRLPWNHTEPRSQANRISTSYLTIAFCAGAIPRKQRAPVN
jgi:hypothetical protein